VVNIISKGSMKCHLQDIALDIYKQCLNYNLSLDVEWIPRTENERADFISRIVDFTTGISQDLFLYVDSFCFMYCKTLNSKHSGGTNKPLIPPQLTLNASMPIYLTFQYLE
jgi:hypothetical protein